MKSCFAVALLQMGMGPDPEANLQKGISLVHEAADKGADVACLPELFRSRYFCQKEDPAFFDLAEKIPGPATEALSCVAREAKIVVVVPVFERRGPGICHNSLAVIDADGSIAGIYRKMHIPDDPLYYEKFYFTPGDLGFRAFETKAGRIGALICWDQWFPEGARLTTLAGASILFYPTAIGWHPGEKDEHGDRQLDAWRTVQRGHAIANGVYVAAVNRIGHEIPDEGGAGIQFWGNSFICDPQGVVIAEASAEREEVIIARVDLALLEDIRRNWQFLRDRRTDAYAGITRLFLDDQPGGKE